MNAPSLLLNVKNKLLEGRDETLSYDVKEDGVHTEFEEETVHLIQEDLACNPWMVLVATIFLNKTRWTQARTYLWDFLNEYLTPEIVSEASVSRISTLLEPLGFQNRRAERLIVFSKAFIQTPNFTLPSELPGIGKYGDDSWNLFCGPWKEVFWAGEGGSSVEDKELKRYVNWRRSLQCKI
ncbi:Methyl-CpG-binding domain protein 4 [Chytridiales sp. JEL 0842]|nr:Methyl-CpG-binding domain protein 4 [Chytridiales sp. JEL 0842]